jgi:hypothetical protein
MNNTGNRFAAPMTEDFEVEGQLAIRPKMVQEHTQKPLEAQPRVRLRAAEFWRAPVGVEHSVAFSDIQDRLNSFEDTFVKAVSPIQAKQTKALVNLMATYIEQGKYDQLAEIDVPYRTQVADSIEKLLSGMVDFGAEQVKREAKVQGATAKAKDLPNPPDNAAFIRVRALAIANILANKMRAALSWEALRQLRAGELDKGRLTMVIDDLSDQALRTMSKQSAGEALNLGRQEQANVMDIKATTSSALMDDNTCGYCRSVDSKSWTPGKEPMHEPPYDDCEGRDRCRCIWVFTFSQEV